VTETEQQVANLQAVRASARLNALDRYYAALFAPAAVRDDLIALAAFSGEIARIGRQVSEPAVGEIRIAWWRDALLAAELGAASGNPVLDVFAAVVKRHTLSSERIEDFLSAHAEALYADAPADDRALNRRLRAIDGTPLALAANILGVADNERANEVLDAAARAAGMARIGLELPYELMHGRSPLPVARSPNPFESPADWRPQIAWLAAEAAAATDVVRRHLADKPQAFITAFLPLALVGPYFRALQMPRHEPTRDLVEIAPLARLWRIARAHWTGRL
jgi:15-cis-phytoene synthase